MDTLMMIGLAMAFIAGSCFGAAVMYFGGLIIEWQVERQFEEEEETA